jgi:multiple sugar transport system substrate-binding protein
MWNDTIKPLIPEFEKETGMTVSLESYEESQLTQKLTIEFASGNSTVDAFMTRPLQEGKMFAKAGWYEPLDNYVKADAEWDWNDFMKANADACVQNGKLVSVPLVNECETLFYRKDLFDAKGIKVPTTLEELEAAAQALNDPANEVYGIVSRGNMGAAVTQFSSYLYGFGGDFIKDGKCVIDSPEAVEALTYYGRLLNKYGPPGVINMSWPQAVALFASGKAAMYTDASVMLANMVKEDSKIVGKIGVAPFPAGPKGFKPYMVTSWALAVSPNSKNKDAAWEFLKWSTSKDNMTKGQLNGVSQTRNSVWSDPAITAKLLPGFEEVSMKSAEAGFPYDRPVMTSVGEARDAIGSVIVKSITSGGTDDIAALAKEAAQKVDQLLKDAGEAK